MHDVIERRPSWRDPAKPNEERPCAVRSEAWSPVAVSHMVGPMVGPYPAPRGMAWSGTYAPDGSPLGEPVLVPVPGFPVSEHMTKLDEIRARWPYRGEFDNWFIDDASWLLEEVDRVTAVLNAVLDLGDPERFLRTALGESLMRARLALTALDVAEVELDSASTEARAILSALCALLVEAGAVDPMEVD